MRRGWVWLLVVGCGVPTEIPEEDFAHTSADVLCRRTRECSRGLFEAAYFGMADCVAHYELQLQQFVDVADSLDCEYDAAEAATAYVEVSEMTCEDFYEGDYLTATAEVWPDCGLTPTDTYYGYYDF